ncbi:predicted protein [Naegleria gruberi]|uniref:Predicted protein n=1 Tax=Naegleria gruberi TaxID=5762 RepID=D2W411_NAEGR|nr:uncharacterized protein NAEGRDRAFT_76141 [Naegleria gruberi]EFC36164.1 predicted protein [Naegleria gruberi]|eukprot:XP_002668908.1 predicted protein [Naegleria gruberi strain NEG-M]
MSPDTLELIFSYLEAKYRMVMELVCLDLRLACLSVESREFFAIFNQLNDETLVCKPLREGAVDDEEIEVFERRMPGFKVDFYTRELLKTTNGRIDWNDSLFHPVNMIAPIQEWTKDFGYLYYKDKAPILELLQLSDFNFVHDCLVCIGSTSQKICWGMSEDLIYNPFHTRTRKLYADKNFNLYDLEYRAYDDYAFKKLGKLKKWLKSFLPQKQLNVKIVPKREPIRFATEEKKNDPEFVTKYLKTNGSQLKYVSKELRNNKEIVMVAVSNYVDAIQFASDEIKDDDIFMKDILQIHPLTIRFCSERVKGTHVTKEALKAKPFRMKELPSLSIEEFIPRSVIDDKEYALSMIDNTCSTYHSLSDNLKNDRDICLRAVKNRLSISQIPPIYADDKEIALTAVRLSSYEYLSISERLKRDRDVALIALKNSTQSIVHKVPEEIRGNSGLIMESITKTNARVLFEIASEELKTNDRELILKFLVNHSYIYHSLNEALKQDVEIFSSYLLSMIEGGERNYYRSLELLPNQVLYLFCNDYTKAVLLFRAHPIAFELINRNLRANKNFILEILEYRPIDISKIDHSLLCDEDVLMKLADRGLGEELMNVLPNLQNGFKMSAKMIEHLVATNPITIDSLKQTPELVKIAITHGAKCRRPVISLIKEEMLTLELVEFALKSSLCRWPDVPLSFHTKDNILQILKSYPKLYGLGMFGLGWRQRQDLDFINLSIREPTNFKEIPPSFLTSELVIEAIQHNNAANVEQYIYPHLPVVFYENEQVYNLLREKISYFK